MKSIFARLYVLLGLSAMFSQKNNPIPDYGVMPEHKTSGAIRHHYHRTKYEKGKPAHRRVVQKHLKRRISRTMRRKNLKAA